MKNGTRVTVPECCGDEPRVEGILRDENEHILGDWWVEIPDCGLWSYSLKSIRPISEEILT